MSYIEMSSPQAEQLTQYINRTLRSNELSQHLKRVWVFQKRCLVLDFAYKEIHFGFDFILLSVGRLSVDLVQRGKLQGAFQVTGSGKRKDALVAAASVDEAIDAVIAKILDLLAQIDTYHSDVLGKNNLADTFSDSASPTINPTLIQTGSRRSKIGVLTLPLNKNYGGNLQAYALMQTLRDLGYDPVLINRRYAAEIPAQLLSQSAHDDTHPIANKIDIETDCDNRSFIENYILPITRAFRTSEQLRKGLADYDLDAVVAGSDQVWRPKYARGLLMDFFHGYLDTEDRSIRRISYAASFGTDIWEFSKELTQKASRLIELFDAVSVREDSAVDLCRVHLGAEARHVLDPTLLLAPKRYFRLFSDQLNEAAERRITSYILDPNPEKLRLMEAISGQLSMGIVSASGQTRGAGATGNDKSVESWLAAFYQANFVVTDSFHGVAFSILFNRPFIAFGNPLRGMARFTSILRMFGLEDRLVIDIGMADVSKLLQPIDWIAVNRQLDEQRRQSINFLHGALARSPNAGPKPPKGGPKPPAGKAPTGPAQLKTSASATGVAKAKIRIPFDRSNPLKVMCTGCGVCVSESQGSLSMAWDPDGFWVPKATATPVRAQAVRVCPFNPAPEPEVRDEDALGRIFHADAANSHPRGGHFENTFIGYSNAFRPTSSSGGVATYVFDQLLRRKELDYLFVVRGDDDCGYHYQVFRDEKDIKSISNTRYFPVTLDELFSTIEKTKGRVGVSGVACFIKAIRLKQYYHPELREKIPFLVGIICGGLKSRYYTDFLARSAGVEGSYSQAQYRVKNPQSEANDYFFSVNDSDSNTHQVRMRLLGDMWGSGLFKNKACDFCTDVLTELADISLGDAWIPRYNRDGMGNSVVVTRSRLADRIIREGITSGDLTMETVPIDLIVRSQSGGVNHKLNALRFRLWMSRNYTDLPIPACRTRVEKELSAADMLVQILRERVRSNSLRFWPESENLGAFNRRMRSSRMLLQAVTSARKKQPEEIYDALVATLDPRHATKRPQTEMVVVRPMLRWLKRKLFTQEVDLADLEPLLPEEQKTGRGKPRSRP